MQVQGTSSFTAKYIRRVGEAGCCLDDSLKFSYLKKQDLLRHAMGTCHLYIYTVQGQGLAPLALGLARPDPTRALSESRTSLTASGE